MRSLKALLLCGALAGSIPLFAQSPGFQYRRPIEGISKQWHSLTLPVDLYGKAQIDLKDLRILGVNKTGDTLEAPYLLNHNYFRLISADVPFELINKSQNEKGYYYTYKLSKAAKVTQIDLQFDNRPFDTKASLEGSNDGTEWFTITEDQRIGSVVIKDSLYHYSTLSISPSSYSYYRLCIVSPMEPGLLNTSIKDQSTQNGASWVYPTPTMETSGTKRQTLTLLSFGTVLPVDRVKMNITSKFDFYRAITIPAASDSILRNGKYVVDYETVYSGLITSWTNNEFLFNQVNTRGLRIIIENGDNEPLIISSPEISAYKTTLTVRFTKDADYFLYYGNRHLSSPVYELEFIKDKIPAANPTLILGEEQDLRKPLKSRSPLDLSTTWLWAVIGLIMVTLGGFTVNMWRKRA